MNADIPLCQYPGNKPNISGLTTSGYIVNSAIIFKSNNSNDLYVPIREKYIHIHIYKIDDYYYYIESIYI